MSLRAFALLLAFSLAVFSVLVALGWQSRVPGPAPRSESKTAGNTVARFATDDFVVACRVQPEALIAHPYFGSLPIHIFVPPPLSLRRLDTMDVEELVVFCGPATGSERDEKQAGDLPPQSARRVQWIWMP